MKTFFAAFALLVMGALYAGPSMAAPISPATSGLAVEDMATPARYGDYGCRRDGRGWHSMYGERRRGCRPDRPRGDRHWGWKCDGPRCGWWHPRERRWHDRD